MNTARALAAGQPSRSARARFQPPSIACARKVACVPRGGLIAGGDEALRRARQTGRQTSSRGGDVQRPNSGRLARLEAQHARAPAQRAARARPAHTRIAVRISAYSRDKLLAYLPVWAKRPAANGRPWRRYCSSPPGAMSPKGVKRKSGRHRVRDHVHACGGWTSMQAWSIQRPPQGSQLRKEGIRSSTAMSACIVTPTNLLPTARLSDEKGSNNTLFLPTPLALSSLSHGAFSLHPPSSRLSQGSFTRGLRLPCPRHRPAPASSLLIPASLQSSFPTSRCFSPLSPRFLPSSPSLPVPCQHLESLIRHTHLLRTSTAWRSCFPPALCLPQTASSSTSFLASARRTTPARAATQMLHLAPLAQSVSILRHMEVQDADDHTATLYDIGTPLNKDPLAKWKIPSISPLALSLSTQPQILEWSLKFQDYDNVIGHHFFNPVNGANTPVFALDQLSVAPYPMALVGKLGDTVAPATACPGLSGEGAVKWLYLRDTKGISQGGIDTVYRLETAGGAPPATCQDQPASFEVRYATQCKFHRNDCSCNAH